MKALLVACVVLLIGFVGVVDAQLCPGLTIALRPMGYESLTVSATAVFLTPPMGSELAVGVLEGGAVRFRDDGTAPTADEGLLVMGGGNVIVCTRSLISVRFIKDSATDGVLKVAYYGR